MHWIRRITVFPKPIIWALITWPGSLIETKLTIHHFSGFNFLNLPNTINVNSFKKPYNRLWYSAEKPFIVFYLDVLGGRECWQGRGRDNPRSDSDWIWFRGENFLLENWIKLIRYAWMEGNSVCQNKTSSRYDILHY